MLPFVNSVRLLSPGEKWQFFSVVVSRILIHIFDLAGLAGIGILATMLSVQLGSSESETFLFFDVPEPSRRSFGWLLASVGLLFMLKSLFSVLLIRIATLLVSRMEARASDRIARFLYLSDIERFRSLSLAEFQWLANSASAIAISGVLSSGATLITELALAAFIFAGFLAVDLPVALSLIGFVILNLVVFQVLVEPRLGRLSARLNQNGIAVNGRILDLSAAFRESAAAGTREFFLGKLSAARERMAMDRGLQRLVIQAPRYLIELVVIVGALVIVAWQVFYSDSGDGLVTVAFVLAGGLRLAGALVPIQNALNDLRVSKSQAEKAQEIISLSKNLHDTSSRPHEKPLVADNLPPRIEVSNLSFTYSGDSRPILKSVTFQIEPGQFVAIVGKSGSGKSTLVDLLLGILGASSGQVLVDGSRPDIYRGRRLGVASYVPQKSTLVQGTVVENVALGVPTEDVDRLKVEIVLRKVGLWDEVSRFPRGLDEMLGDGAALLSGGQLQRLGLARALYFDPVLLALDEPTSALDDSNEEFLGELMRELRGQVTIVMIAHRQTTIRWAGRVIELQDGKLVHDSQDTEAP